MNLLLAVMSLSITLGLVAAAGEVAVRHREKVRTNMPGTMPTLFYQHRRMRHGLVRDFDYFGWAHVDSLGFRGTPVALRPTPGTFRVMIVGASTTFDSSVADEHAWPFRLSHWLGELAPDRPVEVINAGVPGFMVIDNVVRLQTELYRLEPDLILLYQAHNDLYTALRFYQRADEVASRRPGAIEPVTPWGRWLAQNSVLYGKLRGRFGVISFRNQNHAEDPGRLPRALADGQEQFARDVSAFVALVRELGIDIALADVVQVTGPSPEVPRDTTEERMWRATIPFADMPLIRAGYASYADTLQAIAGRHGIPFISTADFGLVGVEWYAEDDPIHFNPAGSDRMAERMARTLLGMNLLDRQ